MTTTYRSAADGIPLIDKDPSATLDYIIDLAALGWLQGSEVINSITVTADAGLTVQSSSYTNTAITVWLTGGTVGQTMLVTVHFTTSQNRADDRSFRCFIKQR